MCDSMNSALKSYNYGDNLTKMHKIGSTPLQLSSNPIFLASNSIMGCRSYSIPNLGKNPRKKDQFFTNQRYKSCVYNSIKFNFSCRMSLKEGNELGFEFSNHNEEEEDGDGLKVYVEKDENLSFDEILDAKDGILSGEMLVKEGEDEIKEVKMKKNGNLRLKSRRNSLMKRSNLIAKQVIGIQSGFSLGFVSQIWVDTSSWVVLEIEVKPSLLSSESGKVLLEDIERVGDVVLVQDDDESFVLNDFRLIGLETLIGYRVVTPEGRYLGKVRGYFFDINSGAVESLELDAFGNPLVPLSLVSTYALFTEDVRQVVSDTIIVHQTALSRIQRLTKGFLSTTISGTPNFNREYDDFGEESVPPVRPRKSRRKSSKRRSYTRTRKFDDDLDLPMDYM